MERGEERGGKRRKSLRVPLHVCEFTKLMECISVVEGD